MILLLTLKLYQQPDRHSLYNYRFIALCLFLANYTPPIFLSYKDNMPSWAEL